MNSKLTIIFTLILISISTFTFASTADTVVVDVNLDVKHTVGKVSTFDRAKFVTIHSDITENDWTSGSNAVNDFKDDFLNGYDVYMGRNTGGITWWLNAKVPEDANRTGFADSAYITQNGQYSQNTYATKTKFHPYEYRNNQVICAQLHPFYPDGTETQNGWSLSETDTETEPFGTATGEYMGRYIRDFFGTGGTNGQNRPNYVEVVNEPLWDLVTLGNEDPEKIFRFHNAVADEIKKLNDSIQIGGFCSAFPDIEKDDFQRWEERWKLFMDVSGKNMDFWSIHLYDFPAFGGKQQYRKGAQMEATLDMMEQYSYLKFGKAKPFLISEFGASSHDYFAEWSPFRDWLHVKSCSPMMMQFMRRPNLITKAINYVMLKAEWGYNATTGSTWNHRLMRKANEPNSYTGDWVYSDMVKLYQLWADVNGVRVDSRANNLDILSDSYIDGNKVYVLVNSLDLTETHKIKLNLLGAENKVQSLKIRNLHLIGSAGEMEETITSTIPETFEIAPEGTLILEYTYSENIEINESSDEIKYYASEYFKSISANQTINFNINNVQMGSFGETILRLGIGRAHGKEIFPEVTFNGTPLSYPKNYRGDDQKQRLSFFGVLEITVPQNLLKNANNISVKFPDSGGYVSSVAMQVYSFSKELKRFQNPITGIHSIHESSFQIFPNPASNHIQILSGANEATRHLEIYTLEGKKILYKDLTSSTQTINIEHITEGLYLVKIKTPNNCYSHKLVIKK